MAELITFFKDDKEYKSPTTNQIKDMLKNIGIDTNHHCLIRKQVHIIINGTNDLDLSVFESDSDFEKTVKKEILEGNRSITLVV